MQLVASLAVVVLGLILLRTHDVAGDMRFFGWVLVAVGVAGLLTHVVLSRAGRRPGG